MSSYVALYCDSQFYQLRLALLFLFLFRVLLALRMFLRPVRQSLRSLPGHFAQSRVISSLYSRVRVCVRVCVCAQGCVEALVRMCVRVCVSVHECLSKPSVQRSHGFSKALRRFLATYRVGITYPCFVDREAGVIKLERPRRMRVPQPPALSNIAGACESSGARLGWMLGSARGLLCFRPRPLSHLAGPF